MTVVATLVFDGNCGSCGWFAKAAKSLDTAGRLRLATLQDPEVEKALRPSLGKAYDESFHLVDEKSGRVRSGQDALLELARLLPAVRPFAEVAFALPVVRRLPGMAYKAASAARRCALPPPRPD